MKKCICLLLALLFILGLVGCNRDELVDESISDVSSANEISDEQRDKYYNTFENFIKKRSEFCG